MRNHNNVIELFRANNRGRLRSAFIFVISISLGICILRPDFVEWGKDKIRSLAFAGASTSTNGPSLANQHEGQGAVAGSAPVEALSFPKTGDVRWFINPESVPPHGKADLKIIGSNAAGRNTTVKLENWTTKEALAVIPIRSGETAHLQVPFGQYRLFWAQTSHPYALVKFGRGVHEALQPLKFGMQGNNIVGHVLDFNTRIDGNLHSKPVPDNLM